MAVDIKSKETTSIPAWLDNVHLTKGKEIIVKFFDINDHLNQTAILKHKNNLINQYILSH
uniref:Uncharacterized protein n=1 Tax=Myoviridae sp. ctoNH1 TaxID=2826695 RepID=A0A8S5QRK0_9CAUD|nr:MAG TPA: Protein of unknown function (DUF1480) [Myoviridae sp. ctoNH1]